MMYRTMKRMKNTNGEIPPDACPTGCPAGAAATWTVVSRSK
jgi:hypothetical protein